MMSSLAFEIDFYMLLAVIATAILLIPFWHWHQVFHEPSLSFSSLIDWPPSRGRVVHAYLPRTLMWMALIAFSLAFINPRLFVDRNLTGEMASGQRMYAPTEGIAIYLVLDQSGSMKEYVPATILGRPQLISKTDLVKTVSTQFIKGAPSLDLKGRPNDLIGLIFFARAAKVMAPLTLDHQAILTELQRFDTVPEREQDGTSIGYALYKTTNLINATRHYAQELVEKGEPAYTIKNSVIVLITDGLQDPNPLDKGKRLRNMDIPEAAEYARQEGVRLYIINVEPKLSTEEFLPYRHIMQRAAESTNGKFYMVDNSGNLEDIMREIDQLEKSKVDQYVSIDKDNRPDLYRRTSLYPFLLAFGLICIFISWALETFFLRRVP